jgi:hypothetical protein
VCCACNGPVLLSKWPARFVLRCDPPVFRARVECIRTLLSSHRRVALHLQRSATNCEHSTTTLRRCSRHVATRHKTLQPSGTCSAFLAILAIPSSQIRSASLALLGLARHPLSNRAGPVLDRCLDVVRDPSQSNKPCPNPTIRQKGVFDSTHSPQQHFAAPADDRAPVRGNV